MMTKKNDPDVIQLWGMSQGNPPWFVILLGMYRYFSCCMSGFKH